MVIYFICRIYLYFQRYQEILIFLTQVIKTNEFLSNFKNDRVCVCVYVCVRILFLINQKKKNFNLIF